MGSTTRAHERRRAPGRGHRGGVSQAARRAARPALALLCALAAHPLAAQLQIPRRNLWVRGEAATSRNVDLLTGEFDVVERS